jgi:hypothetical protein
MGVIPQAIGPNPHTNLLNVYIQIANKMGFQKKKLLNSKYWVLSCICGVGVE